MGYILFEPHIMYVKLRDIVFEIKINICTNFLE